MLANSATTWPPEMHTTPRIGYRRRGGTPRRCWACQKRRELHGRRGSSGRREVPASRAAHAATAQAVLPRGDELPLSDVLCFQVFLRRTGQVSFWPILSKTEQSKEGKVLARGFGGWEPTVQTQALDDCFRIAPLAGAPVLLAKDGEPVDILLAPLAAAGVQGAESVSVFELRRPGTGVGAVCVLAGICFFFLSRS